MFLTLLVELAVCALFVHLSPADDSLGMNLVVALAAFFAAIVPFLLIGLAFSSSSIMNFKLRRAKSASEIKRIFEGMKKKIRAKAIGAFVFFLLVSAVLLLYIVCFSHLASDSMREDWRMSCLITVALDLVVFELVAGVLFGLFASCYGSCRSTKSLLCFLVALEFYRIHRNLV